MVYEITAEWEIDDHFHDMHFEEEHFGTAMEKYMHWISVVSKIISMASSTAKGTVTVVQGVDVFFRFSMQVE